MNADFDPEQIMCVLGAEYTQITQDSPTMQAISIISKYILQKYN